MSLNATLTPSSRLLITSNTNTTAWSLPSSFRTGNASQEYGKDDLGDLVPCVGPTPPPNLTFPIETVVQKLLAVDGPTKELILNEDDPENWFWTTSTFDAATTAYITFTREQIPQLNPWDGDSRQCCGMCTIDFSLVDVLYWPVPGANTACLDDVTSKGLEVVASSALMLPGNISVTTAIGPDGFTYTSPSIYVAYHDISASDRCGQIGPKHTSITLSFAPGALSTLDYAPFMFNGPYGGRPKPFDPSNLPCPPESLLDAQKSANGVGLYLPARPSYAPIIVAPPAIENLEPAWKECRSVFVFDPPRSLVPATAMVPSPTPEGQAGALATPAMPSPKAELPPVQTQAGSGPLAIDPTSNTSGSKDDIDPGKQGGSGGQSSSSDQENALVPHDSPDSNSSPNPNEHPDNSPSPARPNQGTSPDPAGKDSLPDLTVQASNGKDPQQHAADPSQPGNNGVAQTSSTYSIFAIGSQTLTAFPPNSMTSANRVLNIAGQTFTLLGGSDIVVDGIRLSVEGPPATVSGTVISAASFGVIIGGHTYAIPIAVGRFSHVTITPLGSRSAIVDGTTLSVNGPAATIFAIAISLASFGLVIGSQTYSLSPPEPTEMPDTIVIDGTILTAGRSAVTISGNAISLAFGGPTGLYITRMGSGASTLTVPVSAGESISLDVAGHLVVDGKTGGAGSGGLGTVIVLGFGPTSTGSANGAVAGNANPTTGVLPFTGEGSRKSLDVRIMLIVRLALGLALLIS